MAKQRLSRQFRRSNDASLLDFSNFIHQQVSTRTSVFSTPSPNMTELLDGITEFQSAKNAAGDRGRLAIRQKNVARKALIALLDQLCNYVEFIAAGDNEIAAQSGFPFTKQPEPRTITVPTDLTVMPGNQPGELEISVKRVPGAVSYMHQYSTDPTLKEDKWMSMNCSQTKCLLTGLTPATTFFIRVGAVGTKAQVLFSNVVSKIAAYRV